MPAGDPKANLVDVRTEPQWAFTGAPGLSRLGRQAMLFSPQVFPTMNLNAGFAAALEAAAPERDTTLPFVCLFGGRSAAAKTDLGDRRCFNVAGGFEGRRDGVRHRGRVDGWTAAGLPWTQG